MKMRRFACIAVVAGLVVTVAVTAATAAAPKTITIGVLSARSGAVAPNGINWANSVQLAASLIGLKGGIKSMGGAKIALKIADDGSTPATARQGAIDLITRDKVSAILGPTGSPACLGAAPVAEQYKVPLICSGTSGVITSSGYKYVFNAATLNTVYSGALWSVLGGINSKLAVGKKLTKVALLYEDGAFGAGVAATIQPPAGFEVVNKLSFHTGTSDLSPLVNRAVSDGAQVIYSGAFIGDNVNLVRAIKTQNAKLLLVSFSGAVQNPAMTELGSIANGVVALSNWAGDLKNRPAAQSFSRAYEKRFQTPATPDAAVAWMASYELKAALEKARSTDGTAIAGALRSLTFTINITRKFGLKYDANGSITNQAAMVVAVQLQKGKFVTIWPADVAAAKPILP